MPRYFFDFRRGEDHCQDLEGVEFADVEHAYLEAFKAAQEMWGEFLRERRDPRHCIFEVRNAGRDLLFIFPFEEVIESCTDRKRSSPPKNWDVTDTAHRAKRLGEEVVGELQSLRDKLAESRALLAVKV